MKNRRFALIVVGLNVIFCRVWRLSLCSNVKKVALGVRVMLTLNGVGVWCKKQVVSEKNNGHHDMHSREVMHTE